MKSKYLPEILLKVTSLTKYSLTLLVKRRELSHMEQVCMTVVSAGKLWKFTSVIFQLLVRGMMTPKDPEVYEVSALPGEDAMMVMFLAYTASLVKFVR